MRAIAMSDLSFSGPIARPLWAILFGRRGAQGEKPSLSARWSDIPLIELDAYQHICGFAQKKEAVWPITYPRFC